MADNETVELRGRAWIEQACAAVDVDPDVVDVGAILDLTRRIAHTQSRPLAPVGSYILGVAIGAAGASGTPPEDRARLLAAMAATLPDQRDAADDG